MDIRHVLLIPEEGDPHGLLREGPRGARPPMMWEYQMGQERRWITPRHADEWEAYATGRRALVLARDGEVVEAGCFRAGCPTWWAIAAYIELLVEGHPKGLACVRQICATSGTIVRLDADGRGVTDG